MKNTIISLIVSCIMISVVITDIHFPDYINEYNNYWTDIKAKR